MKIKILLALLISSFSVSSFTEVAECYSWNANPGKSAQFMNSVQEAAVIHTKLGANVGVYAMNVGGIGQEIQYCMRWDNILEWGKSKDKMAQSQEMQAFFAKASQNPTGTLVATISGANLDQSAKADLFDKPMAFQVQVWEVAPGRTLEAITTFQEAEKIIESLGMQVEIYQEGAGGNGKMHYVIASDNWTKLSEGFAALGTSEKWNKFIASVSPDGAKLISTHNGSAMN